MRVPLSEAIYRSGLGRAIGWRYQGCGVIFMFHSIVDEPGQYLYDPLRCSPGTLEMALKWARDQKLDIVSMDEVMQRLEMPQARRFAAFTFDDGYRDNVTKALPVFERYEAPMTIYITTSMITRQLYAWWDALVVLIRDNDTLHVESMDRRFALNGVKAKAIALTTIKHWIHCDGYRAECLRPVFAKHGIDTQALVDDQAMTLEEMKQASAHPLVTIGGHTTSHSFLTLQSNEQLYQEVADNKEFLERAVDGPIKHFSYPYGAAGPREAEAVRKAGFKTAVTTRNGAAFPHHATTEGRYELPREAVDSFDTVGCLDCRSRGVYRFLKSRAGNPVVQMAADHRHERMIA